MTAWTTSSVGSLALLCAFACGGEDRAGTPTASGGRTAASQGGASNARGGSTASGGSTDAAAGDAATAGEASSGGATTDGPGAGGASDGGVGGDLGTAASTGLPMDGPATCPLELEASAGTELPIGGNRQNAGLLGGLSVDELQLAWVESSEAGIELFTASRADRDRAFSGVRTQAIPAAFERVALSADGLRVVFVNPERTAFVSWERPSLDEDFVDTQSVEFSLLLDDGVGLAEGEQLLDPVLSADDNMFVFSRVSGDRKRTLFKSHRFSPPDAWPPGVELGVTSELEADGSDRFAPTGLSSDMRTLFGWRAELGQGFAASLGLDSGQYGPPSSLGGIVGGTPNADCSRLYHSGSDARFTLWESEITGQ